MDSMVLWSHEKVPTHSQPKAVCWFGAAKTPLHNPDWGLTWVTRVPSVSPSLPADPQQAPMAPQSRTTLVSGPPHGRLELFLLRGGEQDLTRLWATICAGWGQEQGNGPESSSWHCNIWSSLPSPLESCPLFLWMLENLCDPACKTEGKWKLGVPVARMMQGAEYTSNNTARSS